MTRQIGARQTLDSETARPREVNRKMFFTVDLPRTASHRAHQSSPRSACPFSGPQALARRDRHLQSLASATLPAKRMPIRK